MRRSVLFLTLFLFCLGAVQAQVRVVTTSTDPNGTACTATSPPTILLYNTGSTFTHYICTSSTWSATTTGAGDVVKVATPADNQVGVWTGDGTIEGDADLTFDGTTLTASVKRNTNAALSAATTVSVDGYDAAVLSGFALIDTINTCNSSYTGHEVTLRCGAYDQPWVMDGDGNIELAYGSKWICAPNQSLTLICDGSTWRETNRTQPSSAAGAKVDETSVTSYTVSAGVVPYPIGVDGTTIYGRGNGLDATAERYKLYKSTDYGATWSLVFDFGSSAGLLRDFRMPDDGKPLVITSKRVYKSTETTGTVSWNVALNQDASAANFLSWATDTWKNYATITSYTATPPWTDSRYFWLSDDYGATWTAKYDTNTEYPATATTSHVHGTAIDPWTQVGGTPRLWFAWHETATPTSHLMYSDDLGTTWIDAYYTDAYTANYHPTTLSASWHGIVNGRDKLPSGLRSLSRPDDTSERPTNIPVYTINNTGTAWFSLNVWRDPESLLTYTTIRSANANGVAYVLASDGASASLVWSKPDPDASNTNNVDGAWVVGTKFVVAYNTDPGGAFYYEVYEYDRGSDFRTFDAEGLNTGNILNGYTDPTLEGPVAVGPGAQATATDATAMGASALATGNSTVAIGSQSKADTLYGIAIGYQASNTAGAAVVIGGLASSALDNTTVVGNTATATGVGGTVVGDNATAANDSTVVGSGATGGGTATAIGDAASATGSGATAVGKSATANNANGIAIGRAATTGANNQTVVGRDATGGGGVNATVVGYSADATNNYVTAVGSDAQGSGNECVALGYQANCSADDAVALGQGVAADVADGISIGERFFVAEGTTADTNETILAFTDPTADRTITMPDATGTVALINSDVAQTINFGADTSLEIPNGTSGTTDADGELYLDTDGDGGTNFSGAVVQADTGAATQYLFPMALPLAASQDNFIPKYDAATKTVSWEADAGAAGGDSISIDGVAVVDPDFVSTGQIDFTDTTNTITADINADAIVESDLKAVDSPADEECLTYEATVGDFEWQACGGGSVNSFETISTTSGTSPVADSSTDTLTMTAGTGITITGDSGTDTVTIASTVTDTDTTCNDAGVSCLFAASSSEGGVATSALTVAAGAGTDADATVVTVDRASADATLAWNDTTDVWDLSNGLNVAGTITTTASDGSRQLTFTDNTVEATAPAAGSTILYSLGGELYKKDNGDGTSEQLILSHGVVSGDIAVSVAGAATVQADSVALTTDTTGNYVATVADAGNSTITVTNGSAEGGAVTLDAVDLNCTDCIGTTEIADSYLLNNGDVGTGAFDFGGATLEAPNTNEAGKPGTCTVGEILVTTDGDTNGELYICASTDTWKAVDDDGGAGGISDIASASDTNIVTPSGGQVLIWDGTDTWDNKSVGGEATLASDGTLTIADSVTVTGWAMGASTATTTASTDDDTSLATTAFVQDVRQAQVHSECFTLYDVDGLAAVTLDSVFKAPAAITVTEFWCEGSEATGSVVNMQIDDGTPADLLSGDKTCTTTAGTGTISSGTMADGDRLDLEVVSVAGTPATELSVCIEYTYD